MNVTRTLVSTLLIGSIIAGFVQGLSTQTASGVMTSYSTWASTSYSLRYSTGYSTQYSSMTVTTLETRTQTANSGPYLELTEVRMTYDRGSGDFIIAGKITNLMNMPVPGGNIRFVLTFQLQGNLIPFPATEMIMCPFGRLNPGATLYLNQRQPAPAQMANFPYVWSFMGIMVGFDSVTLRELPITTYTYLRTLTEIYVTTYVATLSVSESQAFFSPAAAILILLLVAGTITAMIIVRADTRKGK